MTTATIGSRSTRRATRWRPSRPPSSASAGRSRRSRPRSTRPRRSSLDRPRPARPGRGARPTASRRWPSKQFASQQTLEAGGRQSRPGQRGGAGRAGRDRPGRRQCRRAQGAAAGSRAHAQRIADRGGQGRARSLLHADPRADRRRVRQPRGAHRRLHADRPAARQLGAARRGLYRRQLQGDAACAPAAGTAGRGRRRRHSRSRDRRRRSSSVSPASGSTFSLLPPDNATGNFTKIVQRIAVRIQVPADVAARRQLRPGMSVVVSVDTRDQPKNGMPLLAGPCSPRPAEVAWPTRVGGSVTSGRPSNSVVTLS